MWDRFFDLDNVVWRTIDKIGKIFLLNLLWLICSLPVFTIGASTTALIYTSMKLSDNEGYWHQNFFSSFKENFKQATALFFIYLAAGAGQDAALPLAVEHGQVQQLLALLQVLAGAHLGHAQLHLAEGVKIDLFLVGKVHGALLGGGGSLLLRFGLGLVGSFGSGLALLVLFLQHNGLLIQIRI